jgi:nitrogen fixation protein FixH
MTTERRIHPWPLALGLGLAFGIAVSLAFLWVASRQPPDRLRVDSAQALREHNRGVLAREQAAARGWDVALSARRNADGAWVELAPTSAGEPLPADLVVSLRRERPERTGMDAEIPLERDGERWRAQVPLPLPGRWIVEGRAERDGETVIARANVEAAR